MKKKPGRFEPLPGEPHFNLLARDPQASALVRRWADLRRANRIFALVKENRVAPGDLKYDRREQDAITIADNMDRWFTENRNRLMAARVVKEDAALGHLPDPRDEFDWGDGPEVEQNGRG